MNSALNLYDSTPLLTGDFKSIHAFFSLFPTALQHSELIIKGVNEKDDFKIEVFISSSIIMKWNCGKHEVNVTGGIITMQEKEVEQGISDFKLHNKIKDVIKKIMNSNGGS